MAETEEFKSKRNSVVLKIQQGWKSVIVELHQQYFALEPPRLKSVDVPLFLGKIEPKAIPDDSKYKKMNPVTQAKRLEEDYPHLDLIHVGTHDELVRRMKGDVAFISESEE